MIYSTFSLHTHINTHTHTYTRLLTTVVERPSVTIGETTSYNPTIGTFGESGTSDDISKCLQQNQLSAGEFSLSLSLSSLSFCISTSHLFTRPHFILVCVKNLFGIGYQFIFVQTQHPKEYASLSDYLTSYLITLTFFFFFLVCWLFGLLPSVSSGHPVSTIQGR